MHLGEYVKTLEKALKNRNTDKAYVYVQYLTEREKSLRVTDIRILIYDDCWERI